MAVRGIYAKQIDHNKASLWDTNTFIHFLIVDEPDNLGEPTDERE